MAEYHTFMWRGAPLVVELRGEGETIVEADLTAELVTSLGRAVEAWQSYVDEAPWPEAMRSRAEGLTEAEAVLARARTRHLANDDGA